MTNQSNNQGGKKKNGGYMIANDRSNDRQPHFRGKVTLEGKEYLVSAWRQEPRDGKDMFSIELTDPATLPQRQNQAQGQSSSPSPRPPSAAPAQSAAPRPPAAPPPAGEDKAFDDIFGGDGSQW